MKRPAAVPPAHTSPVPHVLVPLPYAPEALEPVLGARTLSIHHGEHHRSYVETLNRLLEHEPELAKLPLQELVVASALDPRHAVLFDQAAQVWNHAFYWNSMKPRGGGAPGGALAALLRSSFGGLAGFRTAFVAAAKARFGSGWIWLVHDHGRLVIETTGNADTPVARGKHCLVACDVWEHAYYLDHQARRADYVSAFLERLVDWDFAGKNLG